MAIPPETQEKIANRGLTQREEFAAGYRRAGEVLAVGHGLPKYVMLPKYNYAAEAAILPPDAKLEEIQETGTASEHPPLKTMRGLGPLLQVR